MKLHTLMFIGASLLALSGEPAKPVAASPSPVIIDRSAEIAALQADIDALKAQLAAVAPRPAPPAPQPVAASTPPAATGGPVAYYQRRAVYGGFRGNRIVGYQTVLVTSQQQTYAAGDCPRGNCSTLGRGIIFGRRR